MSDLRAAVSSGAWICQQQDCRPGRCERCAWPDEPAAPAPDDANAAIAMLVLTLAAIKHNAKTLEDAKRCATWALTAMQERQQRKAQPAVTRGNE